MKSSINQYQKWYEKENVQLLSPKDGHKLDLALKKTLRKELDELNSVTINEFYLLHKYQEVQDYINKVGKDSIQQVEKLLYKPTSFEDYKNIDPEIIYVHEGIDVNHTNIYGETTIRQLSNKDNLIEHWQTIRTLVSSSRNDLLLGRALRFLVKDKSTGKYLGILCLGGGLPTITVLNKEYNWNIKEEFSRGGRITNTANGQVIIPVQPAGRLFLLGKLMALLCVSKPVVEKYEQMYGQKLVSVHTTALYGHKGISQYDNLKHYKNLGLTTGSSAIKVTNVTYKKILVWLRKRYPYQYFLHFIERNQYGSLRMRDKKNRILITTFKKLGFKQEEFFSGHKRLVYNSYLYQNAKEYLSHRIREDELLPAFNNDIDSLVNYWKYGDITDDDITKLKVRYQNNSERLKNVIRMKSGVKGHITNLQLKDVSLSISADDWYGEIYNKSWRYTKQRYMKQVGR